MYSIIPLLQYSKGKRPYRMFKFLFLSAFSLLIAGCSSSRRFSNRIKNYVPSNSAPINVLLSDYNSSITIESPVILYEEERAVALVKDGNRLNFSVDGSSMNLNIAGKEFNAAFFELKPAEDEKTISYKGRKYFGILKIISDGNTIRVINRLPLEDYLKGVVPAEMPMGRGESYFQALKAFAICARTYAIDRMKDNNSLFDVYVDTRDQVYGGAGYERELANRAVDETAGMILTYNGSPAIVYYHSSCGGHTEDAEKVFGVNVPYLKGVNDGDPPNCSIAPNFEWTEKYPEQVFVERLISAGLISSGIYSLQNIKVESRDNSGRVSELLVSLSNNNGDDKEVHISGGSIRSAIKTASGKSLLRSTMFDVYMNSEKTVIINGKGYGHGVGLCQWGAINQSINGRDYKQILSFYFPGTEVSTLK